MRNRLLMILAATLLGSSAAFAVEVLDSRLDVEFVRDGRSQFITDSVVPILPGNACFNWHIRLDGVEGTADLLERFTLPEPWEPWVTTPPTDTSVVLEDGKVAETSMTVYPVAGWVQSGWCIDDGDKPGPYRIEVEIAGVAEPVVFDFTYVNPEDYSFVDLYVPGEKDRTINNSW